MHHIVPRSDEEHNDPERMVALCPTHHQLAGPQAERITRDQLYDYKHNPHNSDIVDYDFYFESETPEIKLGGGKFRLVNQEEMTLLRVMGKNLINMSYKNGALSFGAILYNKYGREVAQLSENEWIVYTKGVWDVTYQTESNHLKIWHGKGDIGMEINYDADSDIVSLRGNLYRRGRMIRSTPSKIVLPGRNVLRGVSVTDCNVGINIE